MVPVRERMTTGSIAQARVDFYARFSQMGRGHDLVTGVRARVATDHATFSMIAIDTGTLMGLESARNRAWRPLEVISVSARARSSRAPNGTRGSARVTNLGDRRSTRSGLRRARHKIASEDTSKALAAVRGSSSSSHARIRESLATDIDVLPAKSVSHFFPPHSRCAGEVARRRCS